MTLPRQYSFEVRVPASTANLGAGFDCIGLALELYLTVRATVLPAPGARSHARSRGVGASADLPSSPEENLILRAMRYTAERDNFRLPPVRIAVKNEIPMAGGLGSSAAAIVAGVKLASAVSGKKISEEAILRHAAAIEGHADNVAAALLGGLVVTLVRADGSVAAVKRRWPKLLRVVAITPEMSLETSASRAVLPKTVERGDAVHNLQRAALLVAALEERRYELIWDAMQDRLHQRFRERLIPGLAEILAAPQAPGLLGIALSGAGPSVIAIVAERPEEIGKIIARQFERHGLKATVRQLGVDHEGLVITEKRSSRT